MVLEELYQRILTEGDNGRQLVTIDVNGEGSGIMPVKLEIMRMFNGETVPSDDSKTIVFSVCHTYVQEGDLMSDPYMEFLRDTCLRPEQQLPTFYAIRFKQDGMFATDRDSIILNDRTGKPERYAKKAATADRIFATQWMRNIAWQQKLRTKVRQEA